METGTSYDVPQALPIIGDLPMGWCFTTPSRIANKNAAPSNDRRLSAKVFGPPSPCRTVAVSTREAYPKHRRVVKKQGDDLDKSGCSGYDLDAGSQDYAVYSACSN